MDVLVVSSFEENFVTGAWDAESWIVVERVDNIEEDMIVELSALETIVLNFIRS
jgi:hypothetical protein